MLINRLPSTDSYTTCELDAEDFLLYEGDTVIPGDEIGIDIWSGMPVGLDFWGQISAVHYSPMNHSYRVIIKPLPQPPIGIDSVRDSTLMAA